MPKEQQPELEAFFTQLLQRINEIEEKEKANKNKIELLTNSTINRNKKVDEEIRVIRDELKRLGDEIEKIKQRIDYMLAEMPNLVRKEDLSIIERFIKMWEPLKFVTKEDVERAIEKRLRNSK